MQGDLALHQPPAEIRLRRLRNSVIQRETMTRRNKCAQAHGQKAQSRQGARNCSTRIRDAMAQPLQLSLIHISEPTRLLSIGYGGVGW